MAKANGSLSHFYKQHYEAIATAIQEARRRASDGTTITTPSPMWSMNCAGCSGVITASLVEIVSIGPASLERTCAPGPVSESDPIPTLTEITREFNATRWRMEVLVTTKLTTNSTARELAQQLKFRACLGHAVLYSARNKVKDQLRAAGLKISGFSARDLTALAEEYVQHHREELIQAVTPWVEKLVFKTKR